MEILFEDKSFIVCVKEPGLISQEGRPGEDSVPGRLVAYLSEKGEQPWIFVVHRLDKETGGVMVYARNKYAAARLSAQAAGKEMQKEYLAVVRGCPTESQGEYRDLLFRDKEKNKSFVVKRDRKGVKEAVLEYRVLGGSRPEAERERDCAQDCAPDCTLVQVRLRTGRTHQIRVQFASRQMPLLGDSKYGGKGGCRETGQPSLALWAWKLSFLHPDTGKRLDFSKLPPSAMPWNQFEPLVR